MPAPRPGNAHYSELLFHASSSALVPSTRWQWHHSFAVTNPVFLLARSQDCCWEGLWRGKL